LSKLDPKLLWYTQELIISDFDVTVLVFGKKMRGFSRSREKLEGIDWRSEQFTNVDKWITYEISPEISEGITKFCQEIGVEWGRIDFMKKVDSPELQFLEMNMNGQWVFLDFENEHGLIDEVVEYIENSPTHSQVNLRSSWCEGVRIIIWGMPGLPDESKDCIGKCLIVHQMPDYKCITIRREGFELSVKTISGL
jgi:hypothetical protein